MSSMRYGEALEAAEMLVERSEDDLYSELGLRIQDMQNLGGYERSQQFAADFEQVSEDMLSMGDVKRIGERWWNKLEPELMSLLCEEENEEAKRIFSGKTIPEAVAALTTMALVSALAPPAWIVVATSILVVKVVDTGLDAACEVWKESSVEG